jgi:xanthine dehydrogenase YagR molybdenum-binding subunit
VVGTPIERIDARAKVTGKAAYAAEVAVAHVAHAVIVGSTVARGRLRSVTTAQARRLPGVLAVLTHESAPQLPAAEHSANNPGDRILQLLQDDKIWYADQPIAVVVADTLEHAQHAASLVTASYDSSPPVADLATTLGDAFEPETAGPHGKAATSRGDLDAGLGAAQVKLTQIYTTPIENHNPMEPHATIAVWQGDTRLTLYDATQGIFGVRAKIAKVFGLPADPAPDVLARRPPPQDDPDDHARRDGCRQADLDPARCRVRDLAVRRVRRAERGPDPPPLLVPQRGDLAQAGPDRHSDADLPARAG